MGCVSSKVSPVDIAKANTCAAAGGQAGAGSVPTGSVSTSRERRHSMQSITSVAQHSTPELSEDEDVTYASSSEDESFQHAIRRPSNSSHLFSQTPCLPVHGTVSSTGPQSKLSKHASLEHSIPRKIVPTNTALRGFATESQVLFFKKLDERIREAPEGSEFQQSYNVQA